MKKKILSVLCAALILSGCGQNATRERIDQKILTAAQERGVTPDDIRKDAYLMRTIEMEAGQEASIEEIKDTITVSPEDKANYQQMIGNTLTEKRGILIIFPQLADCESFIREHGADQNPESLGLGTQPKMQKTYYNVTGNAILEAAFDALGDGEYTKSPLEYGGMYCYFKRLSLYAPLQDDAALEDLIRTEKANQIYQERSMK